MATTAGRGASWPAVGPFDPAEHRGCLAGDLPRRYGDVCDAVLGEHAVGRHRLLPVELPGVVLPRVDLDGQCHVVEPAVGSGQPDCAAAQRGIGPHLGEHAARSDQGREVGLRDRPRAPLAPPQARRRALPLSRSRLEFVPQVREGDEPLLDRFDHEGTRAVGHNSRAATATARGQDDTRTSVVVPWVRVRAASPAGRHEGVRPDGRRGEAPRGDDRRPATAAMPCQRAADHALITASGPAIEQSRDQALPGVEGPGVAVTTRGRTSRHSTRSGRPSSHRVTAVLGELASAASPSCRSASC